MTKRLHWILVAVACSLTACGWHGKEYYLERGAQFAEKGKFDDAALQYKKALQKDPKYGLAHLRRGQLLLQQNKPSDAFVDFVLAEQLLPESEEAKVELGRTAISGYLGLAQRPQSLYETAHRTADWLLARNPNSFEGLRIKGYLAVADGHAKEAVVYFRKALQIHSNQPEIVAALVQNLLIDKQDAEAEKLAEAELVSVKNYGPLYDMLYGHYVATQRMGEAERLLKSKIANNPGQAFFVIQLADHDWRQNKTQEADALIRDLAAKTKQYPGATLDAGDFYRRIGKLDDASVLYQKGLDSDPPRRLEYLRRIVSVRLAQGRRQEAAQMLDTILREEPGDDHALASRAALRMASGEPEQLKMAVAEFNSLLLKNPDDNQVRYNLAQAYRQLGQDNDVRGALQEILRRDPDDRAALREMADVAIRNQRPDEALHYAERLLALEPGNVGARLVRTSAWALRGLFDKVRDELRLLTAENPNLPEPWLQLATLDVQERKYADAERIYQRLYHSLKGDTRPLRGLTNLYLVQNQPQKALALLEEESRVSSSPQVRALLVTAATEANQNELALGTARKLASDFPDNSEYQYLMGKVYRRNLKFDQAIASFELAQSLSPRNAVLSASLAEALGNAGRYPEAVAAYKKSLALQPEAPLLMNNLAWYMAQTGKDFDEALALAQRAQQKEPGNMQFADTIGMIYLKSKQPDRALQTLQVIVRKQPANPTFRTHLAMAMLATGERAHARIQLEVALQSRPTPNESREIRRLLASAP